MLEVGNHLKDDFIQVTWHGWQKGNSAIFDLNSFVEKMARLSEILGEISTKHTFYSTTSTQQVFGKQRIESFAIVAVLGRTANLPFRLQFLHTPRKCGLSGRYCGSFLDEPRSHHSRDQSTKTGMLAKQSWLEICGGGSPFISFHAHASKNLIVEGRADRRIVFA